MVEFQPSKPKLETRLALFSAASGIFGDLSVQIGAAGRGRERRFSCLSLSRQAAMTHALSPEIVWRAKGGN